MKELKKQMLEEKIENNLIEDLKEEEIAKYKQNFNLLFFTDNQIIRDPQPVIVLKETKMVWYYEV